MIKLDNVIHCENGCKDYPLITKCLYCGQYWFEEKDKVMTELSPKLVEAIEQFIREEIQGENGL